MNQILTDILAFYIQEAPIATAVIGAVVALLSVRLVARTLRSCNSCRRDTTGVGGEIAHTLCAGTACMMALLSGGVAILSAGGVVTSLF